MAFSHICSGSVEENRDRRHSAATRTRRARLRAVPGPSRNSRRSAGRRWRIGFEQSAQQIRRRGQRHAVDDRHAAGTSSSREPTSIQLRSGSTGPPIHTSSSRSVETGGSRLTTTRPVVTSGRLTTRPNAPRRCACTTDTARAKFGSRSCGIESSSAGARDVMVHFSALARWWTRARDQPQIVDESFGLATAGLGIGSP